MKTLSKYNVLIWDINSSKVQQYDVLPYFRNCWKEKYNKEDSKKIKETKQDKKRKELFKEWVHRKSLYMFWSRCQWEFLISSWPYGSKQFYDDIKEFLSSDYNLEKIDDKIELENIIIGSMEKIDVHQQIEMNIDIIVDILYNEFKLNENKQ